MEREKKNGFESDPLDQWIMSVEPSSVVVRRPASLVAAHVRNVPHQSFPAGEDARGSSAQPDGLAPAAARRQVVPAQQLVVPPVRPMRRLSVVTVVMTPALPQVVVMVRWGTLMGTAMLVMVMMMMKRFHVRPLMMSSVACHRDDDDLCVSKTHSGRSSHYRYASWQAAVGMRNKA